MRILIAPDSFKGSVDAAQAASAIRRGWLTARPGDDVRTRALADGGEGTLDVIAAASHGAVQVPAVVDGPAGRLETRWLLLGGGTAVVELALACGLPLWPRPDPLGAHTGALGQVLRVAATHPEVTRLVVALGGSASTDGGTGALRALGVDFLSRDGVTLPWGAAGLPRLARADVSGLTPPPSGGVEVLTDVTAPLLGELGAATQFGPQKGADPAQVQALDAGLVRLAEVLGGEPEQRGAGAAGGTAYGLATLWGATLAPGSTRVAQLVDLPAALADADLVITGEGRLDDQSFCGKVVGRVCELASRSGTRVVACVGVADSVAAGRLETCVELVRLAGSRQEALARPLHWLEVAGRELARRELARRQT